MRWGKKYSSQMRTHIVFQERKSTVFAGERIRSRLSPEDTRGATQVGLRPSGVGAVSVIGKYREGEADIGLDATRYKITAYSYFFRSPMRLARWPRSSAANEPQRWFNS